MKLKSFMCMVAMAAMFVACGLFAQAQEKATGGSTVIVGSQSGGKNTGGFTSGATNSSYVVKDPKTAQGASDSTAAGASTQKTVPGAANSQAKLVTSTLSTGQGAHDNVVLGASGTQGNYANTGGGNNFAGGANETTGTGTAHEGATNSLSGNMNTVESGSSSGVIQGAGTKDATGHAATNGTSTVNSAFSTPDTAAVPKSQLSVSGNGAEAEQSTAGNPKGNTYAIGGTQGTGAFKATSSGSTLTGSVVSVGNSQGKIGVGTASGSASQHTTATAH